MNKRLGRPIEALYEGVARRAVTLYLPVPLVQIIDARSGNRTKWFIEAAEEKIYREEKLPSQTLDKLNN